MEAQEYEKLIKALRICSSELNCGDCPLLYKDSCSSDELMADAAAAIEALLKENKELIEDHPEMVEADGHWEWRKPNGEVLMPKRGEWIVFNKQMLINLENAREQYKELGYPHRTELGLQCSNCRKVTYVDSGIKYEFCPHCGAKMEVQE